jgi:hypothetical protein
MPNGYDRGTEVRLSCEFENADTDALTDPSTVTLTITEPDHSANTYTYLGTSLVGYVATASAASNASTLAISKPTGTTDGDVMVAALYSNLNETMGAPPAGWTQIATEATSVMRLTLFYKVASSEGASYTFSFEFTNWHVGIISSYSGADTTSPIENYSLQSNFAVAAVKTAPSVVASANSRFVYGIGDRLANTHTATGSERADLTGTGLSLAQYDESITTAGATGTRTITQSNNAVAATFSLILKGGPGAVVVKKASTGSYYADLTPDTEGRWSYRWAATGTVVASGEDEIRVR